MRIADLAGAGFNRLPGCRRQLSLIARALAQEAPALVMDEPTASLDFGNQLRVPAEIAGLADEGMTVVLRPMNRTTPSRWGQGSSRSTKVGSGARVRRGRR